MLKHILKRILLMIPALIVLSMLVFTLGRYMPGDPLLQEMSNDPHITLEMKEARKNELGLNDPLHEQYLHWVTQALKGDFGNSYQNKLPVTDTVGRHLLNTLFLGTLTLIFTYLIAIPLGILAAKYQQTWVDNLILGYNYLTMAFPVFIFAILVLFIFGYKLQWFPTSGSIDLAANEGMWQQISSRLYHAFLPAITVSILATARIIQYLRNELIETKLKDFVRTAKAKGATEHQVYTRHILKNSLVPIMAFLGMNITAILAGNIFIEKIFGYQGIGLLFLTSLTTNDTPVVIVLVMLTGVMILLGTLLSDILMMLLDPRINLE